MRCALCDGEIKKWQAVTTLNGQYLHALICRDLFNESTSGDPRKALRLQISEARIRLNNKRESELAKLGIGYKPRISTDPLSRVLYLKDKYQAYFQENPTHPAAIFASLVIDDLVNILVDETIKLVELDQKKAKRRITLE